MLCVVHAPVLHLQLVCLVDSRAILVELLIRGGASSEESPTRDGFHPLGGDLRL